MYEYIDSQLDNQKAKTKKQFRKTRLQIQKYDALNNIESDSASASGTTKEYRKAIRRQSQGLYKRLKEEDEDFYKLILASLVMTLGYAKTQLEVDAFLKEIGFSLESYLESYNGTMLWVYNNESERKRDRFIEGVIALADDGNITAIEFQDFINRNVNLWNNQKEEIAVDLEREATKQIYKNDGIKKVKWVTMGDVHVCPECRALDGKIFPIDKLPERPHPHCRCEFEPFEGSEE